MATLRKLKWIGAVIILLRMLAAILFVTGAVVVLAWFHAYVGKFDWLSIKAALTDPEKQKDMHPVQALVELLSSVVLMLLTFIGDRLKEKLPNVEVASKISGNSESEWKSIRGDLIKTVRKHWIDDYMHQSLVQRVRIRLGVTQAPDAINRPFSIARHIGGRPERLTDKILLDIFDGSGGSLLILGEPGSGKTFTLVQLAGLLLKRADADPEAAVPVVLPLASWAMNKLPLDEWLTKELLVHYRLSARSTPNLLSTGKRLILLLDGLDEVRGSVRLECLDSIKDFMRNFSCAVVICSRVSEYAALSARLTHGDAIRLLPLTLEQIDKYIDDLQGGEPLEQLRRLIKEDEQWRELATTPLMLNILAVVCLDKGVSDSESSILKSGREAIYSSYIQLMLLRKEHHTTDGRLVKTEINFTASQAIHWLQQIAKRMVKRQITHFVIEKQSFDEWVKSRWKIGLIAGLTTGLFAGFMISSYVGMTLGFFLGVACAVIGGLYGPWIRNRWYMGLILLLMGFLIFGVSITSLFVRAFDLQGKLTGTNIKWLLENNHGIFVVATWPIVLLLGLPRFLRDWVIRLVIAWEGTLPFSLRGNRLIAFLNAMHERLLLAQVGRGWMFIHRELRDYLAAEPFGSEPAEIKQTLKRVSRRPNSLVS